VINSQYALKNRLVAGFALISSFIVYLLTMADTVPYWDSGEFIASSFILGVPHPPGSPLYLIIGRLFSLIPFNADIAYRVNLISPIISALAVMLLYLSIVKIIAQYRGQIKDKSDALIAFGGALTGSMIFAFTDSHWFNAVEAEVYAMSTFFTAIVVWLILHWSERAHKKGNERYLLIIVYMIGLAIGVHLLNLLALPFIAMVIYFRKFDFKLKTFLATIFITLGVYVFINHGIINGLPKLLGSIGLNMVVLITISIFTGMVFSIIYHKKIFSIILTSIVLILIGYSSYGTIFIRSGQNPNIDENNPETVEQAIAYMERQQYGQMFQLPRRYNGLLPMHQVVGNPVGGSYTPAQKREYKFHRLDKQLTYFWDYQIIKMYWRYFLWQFAGRGSSMEPGISSFGANSRQDGVDWFQFGLPLAFLLGVFGLVYHFQRDRKMAISVLTLFLMMGVAIIFYVNQDNPQPRERDYSYVGSFFAFSIWIGIAAAGLGEKLKQLLKNKPYVNRVLSATIILLILLVPAVMLKANYREHDRSGNRIAWDYSYNLLQSCEPNAILFTNGDNDTFPLWYLQEVEGIRTDITVANLSLLNTKWYISQIRDLRKRNLRNAGQEVTNFLNMSDDQINTIASGLMPWPPEGNPKGLVSIPVSGDSQNPEGVMKWEIKPTYGNVALMVKDMMILRIILDSQGEYPVYFAVTVPGSNRLGLDPFLEMEGLVYKVMSHKVNRSRPINVNKMWTNLITDSGSEIWNKNFSSAEWKALEGELWFRDYKPGYLFRNLGLSQIYYFPLTNVRLLQNIRSAYMQLAAHFYMRFRDLNSTGDSTSTERLEAQEKALTVLNKMADNIPVNTIPYDSKDLYYQVGRIYGELGEKAQLKTIMDNLMIRKDLDLRDRIDFAQVYVSELDSIEFGKEIFEELYYSYLNIEQAVEDGESVDNNVWQEWRSSYSKLVSALVYTYKKLGQTQEAELLLDEWVKRNPNDPVAKKLLEEIKSSL